ncbi:MAG: methylthioribose-1-phosphate isomerase [Pseudohongiellaceae bacterium]|jgi:methylthioribose-1-phosphate isomerase
MTDPSLHRPLQYNDEQHLVTIIDQTRLPYTLIINELSQLDDFCKAISSMQVRGAPLIGITAAYGLALALRQNPTSLHHAYKALLSTRPTAINLKWALDKVANAVANVAPHEAFELALQEAHRLRQEDIARCSLIGDYGLGIISDIHKSKHDTIHILTHCNAGWLAAIEWGTALAPIYKAHNAGIPVHVWVDETRPRNQGASLTAWELEQAGVDHTIICDNTGGHLMQQGLVDLCLVGSDRTAANGDVCNKIGTYLKALAAEDNNIPFFVALPSSTVDWSVNEGVSEIPIEQRDSAEVLSIRGMTDNAEITDIAINRVSKAANYAFDVTPARLVTGLITECGVFDANPQGLNQLRGKMSD